jgi:glutathione synthase/RimK-type ligase-like ATP-grasp enzyme
MHYIGLLCNCSTTSDPKEDLSPSLINRAFLIDRMLRPSGIALFLFSPLAVSSLTETAGYTIHGDDLLATTKPMPRVNANWTYGTRRLLKQGMGYNQFKQWTRENQIGIYVPYAFSELVSNKRKTYEVLKKLAPGLHPHTEDFVGSSAQVRSFLDRADLVFIKPRSGNRGNRIFVLRKATGGLSLKYYNQGEQGSFSGLSLETAVGIIEAAADGRSYVIQDGIESARLNGSVFDIRVVMVNDGSQWHSIFETRLGPQGSDLTNIFQGGSIRITESVLSNLFGDQGTRALEEEVRRVSHGIARHLESIYPDALIEIGLDFILDRERRLHLVEINAKPGVAGFGSETKLFEWKAEDEANYQRWVFPHLTHLASFLKAKIESAPVSET